MTKAEVQVEIGRVIGLADMVAFKLQRWQEIKKEMEAETAELQNINERFTTALAAINAKIRQLPIADDDELVDGETLGL